MSSEIIALLLLTFVASFIGTLAGFGSSLIMLPVVVFYFPLPIALLFVGIIHLFNDFWQVLLFKKSANRKLLVTFGIPGIAFSLLGASVIINQNQETILQILGYSIITYVAIILIKPKFKIPNNVLSSFLGGSLSGFFAGITGISGPVRSIFLSSFDLPKETYLVTSGVIAIMIDSTRLYIYHTGGAELPDSLLEYMVLFIVISFIGAEIAKRFVNKIPQEEFRKFIAFFLLLVGIKFALL